jgi:hypothetical protein
MSGIALRDLRAQLGTPHADTRTARDASASIRELRALNVDVDLGNIIDAPALTHLSRLFSGAGTSGDHLRLPLLTQHTGPEMRESVRRILSVETRRVSSNENTAIKEERMRRVLGALDRMVENIHAHPDRKI